VAAGSLPMAIWRRCRQNRRRYTIGFGVISITPFVAKP
jgi:hypothetical protein